MSAPWTVALIVEQEDALRALRIGIAADPRFNLAQPTASWSEALPSIHSLRPDLVLIQVRLPGLGGIDALRALAPRRRPRVVLLTEGAETDFASSPVDCAPLPFEPSHVDHVLECAVHAVRVPESEHRAVVERLLANAPDYAPLERIPIRQNGHLEIVELDRVEWIGAAGNYVELHHDGRRHLYRSPLKDLTARLDPRRFARIHRSAVVNVERVRQLEPTPQGDFKLLLDTGTRLRLSRRFREALDVLLPHAPDASPARRAVPRERRFSAGSLDGHTRDSAR